MRPLKLVIRAFGPYAGEQVLDFRELGDRSLFLIHGATGSGKTTVLDAVSFALYGVCSNGERDVGRVRSHHADSRIMTEVVFDFSLKGREYRVFRRPEQLRPKRKGDGTTVAKAEAELRDRSGAKNDSEEGTILATQWQGVTEAVESLMGFRSNQFSQVVILPQGQFRKLLEADSRERQAILEVLFQTEFYRLVEDALKQAAKNLETEVKEVRRHLGFLLDQAEAESSEELAGRLTGAQEEMKSILETLESLKASERQAQEKLAEGRRIIEKFQELREAKVAQGKLHARKQEITEKGRALERARRAATLAIEEKELKKRLQEAADAAKRLQSARLALAQAAKAKGDASKVMDYEDSRQGEREKAGGRLANLKQLEPQVRELDQALKRLEAAKTEARKAAEAKEVAVATCADLENRGKENEEKLKAAEKTAIEVELLRVKLKEKENICNRLSQLKLHGQEESAAQKELARDSEKLDEAKKSLETSNAELQSLSTRWIEGQAAVLAATLVQGRPCPVCGSAEHPAPAKSDRALPDEKVLKTKTKEVEKLRRTMEEIRNTWSDAQQRVAQARASAQTLRDTLGEPAGQSQEQAEAERDRARRDLKRAEQAMKQVTILNEEIGRITDELTKAKEKGELAAKQYDEAREQELRNHSEAETRRLGIPADLRRLSALNRAQKRAAEELQSLEAALRKAQQDFSEAGEKFSASEAAVTAAQDSNAEAESRAHGRRLEFRQSLGDAGFADEDDFKRSVMSKSQMDRLDVEIRDFDSALVAAGDRMDRAEAAAQGLAEPDMQSLEASAAKSKADLEKSIKELADLEARTNRIAGILAAYEEFSGKLNELEGKYAVVGRIAEVAGGRNREGITFQRFVLAALLDDVLRTASRRLRIMTNGRYTLQRVTERADRRTAGGLDLEVFDDYTGMARSVSTLSGGESFLASLALALGLADVVQAYAGGIQLDTIFVDEGFGSLDPEALDLAFRALVDLQRGGRLVGIISHVPDLRERIDVRLEVTGDRVGSKACFVVG